jgi:hypothetical protein
MQHREPAHETERRKSRKPPGKRSDAPRPANQQPDPPPPADKIDESIWESFPASDPPSFTPQKMG